MSDGTTHFVGDDCDPPHEPLPTMTLPTREEARDSLHNWDIERRAETVVEAYADGVLMTREEWLATIDYQYILDWAIDVGGPNYMTDMQEVRDVVDAALGHDDGCPNGCQAPCDCRD